MPFPHGGRLLRKFLPSQCSRDGQKAGLQVVYNEPLKDANRHAIRGHVAKYEKLNFVFLWGTGWRESRLAGEVQAG